jgi:hypothetical protein
VTSHGTSGNSGTTNSEVMHSPHKKLRKIDETGKKESGIDRNEESRKANGQDGKNRHSELVMYNSDVDVDMTDNFLVRALKHKKSSSDIKSIDSGSLGKVYKSVRIKSPGLTIYNSNSNIINSDSDSEQVKGISSSRKGNNSESIKSNNNNSISSTESIDALEATVDNDSSLPPTPKGQSNRNQSGKAFRFLFPSFGSQNPSHEGHDKGLKSLKEDGIGNNSPFKPVVKAGTATPTRLNENKSEKNIRPGTTSPSSQSLIPNSFLSSPERSPLGRLSSSLDALDKDRNHYVVSSPPTNVFSLALPCPSLRPPFEESPTRRIPSINDFGYRRSDFNMFGDLHEE